MTDLAAIIIRDLKSAHGKNLQERMLEAMLLMERHRGVPIESEIAPEVSDADVSALVIQQLASALEEFIRTSPKHRDVGSAIWALGKLRNQSYAALFSSVAERDSDYDEWARNQALCALEDLR